MRREFLATPAKTQLVLWLPSAEQGEGGGIAVAMGEGVCVCRGGELGGGDVCCRGVWGGRDDRDGGREGGGSVRQYSV